MRSRPTQPDTLLTNPFTFVRQWDSNTSKHEVNLQFSLYSKHNLIKYALLDLFYFTQVYVLVYDAGRQDTFNYVKAMRDQIQEVKGNEALMVIVGNKFDLNDTRPQNNGRAASQLQKRWKCPVVLCSAKYNYHVVDIFKEILKSIESEIDSKKETGNRTNARWRQFDCTVL